jgi:hypothetical protein
MTAATQIVHWPGKDVPSCDQHARVLKYMGESIGSPVSATKIAETGVPCAGCETEARNEVLPK